MESLVPDKSLGDARRAIARTARKIEVGRTYKIPKWYVSTHERIPPTEKCVCTGKYKHIATFETRKGIPLSFSYFELIKAVQQG